MSYEMRIRDWISDVCSFRSQNPVRLRAGWHGLVAAFSAKRRRIGEGRREFACRQGSALCRKAMAGGSFLRPDPPKLSADFERDDASCGRSEEHTSELQSLMRISYAVFCLKNKKLQTATNSHQPTHD